MVLRASCICLRVVVAGLAVLVHAPSARAVNLYAEEGSRVSLGTTARYNLGVRAQSRDPVIATSRNTDEGDALFNQGDVVTNRVDLLLEFDASYKNIVGLRVSGSGWYDFAYPDHERAGPGLEGQKSYSSGKFSSYTKHYVIGPYAEVLDAYAFANLRADQMALNLKAGRLVALWGEAAALSTHSVSYAQAPTDGYKAAANPGVDAKETALPVGQVSATFQPFRSLSMSGQYFFEWQPTRVPEGATYLAGTDFILRGPDQFYVSPTRVLKNDGIVWPGNNGEWGANVRWSPAILDATVGAYYRTFTERLPTISLNLAGGSYRAIYPEKAHLYGVSLSKNVAGVSFGAEVVRREDTALASSISDGALEGARGDTWHGLVNGTYLVGPLGWDSLTLLAEVAYSRLDKVTSGEQYFIGCYRRPAGDQGVGTGCATKDAWQGLFRVQPAWVAVWPGWDITGLASLVLGLKGNSAVLGGGNEGAGSYSIGTTVTYQARHDFALTYTGYIATHQKTAANTIRVSNGSQIQDRGWAAVSYKVSY